MSCVQVHSCKKAEDSGTEFSDVSKPGKRGEATHLRQKLHGLVQQVDGVGFQVVAEVHVQAPAPLLSCQPLPRLLMLRYAMPGLHDASQMA